MKERIKQLCKEKGISIKKLENDLGFGNGYVSKLDKSVPSTDKIQAIANYLGTSVDYLISGKQSAQYYLNDETARIAQEVFDSPDLRLLFDAAKNSRPENIRLAAEMLLRFKETNHDA